jgi:RNA polymerase sigma-70 factor (ECF subfamily)
MTTPPDLAQHFIEALDEEHHAALRAVEGLSKQLTQLAQAGQAAWPALPLEPRLFVRELADRYNRFPPKRGAKDWLDHVMPGDLHLAICCVAGQEAAILAFERLYTQDLDRLVSRYQGPELPAEDLLQSLREKLFVSTDTRAPKLLDYSGQGHLQNWLRVTGTRLFIDLLRSQAGRNNHEVAMPRDQEQRILEMPSPDQDPELEFLKREYREHFRDAFFAAAQSLSSHERNLLRQHIVAGLTVEQLGKLYGVHTATAARRVQRAREALVEATRTNLITALQLTPDELDSIMRLIRSRLDLSMGRILRTATNSMTH